MRIVLFTSYCNIQCVLCQVSDTPLPWHICLRCPSHTSPPSCLPINDCCHNHLVAEKIRGWEGCLICLHHHWVRHNAVRNVEVKGSVFEALLHAKDLRQHFCAGLLCVCARQDAAPYLSQGHVSTAARTGRDRRHLPICAHFGDASYPANSSQWKSSP